MKKIWTSLVVFLTVVLFVSGCAKKETQIPEGSARLTIAGTELIVEVADTPEKQTKGLSQRPEIGGDGMVFLFDQEAKYAFWMKDVNFDLDLIWIRDGIVVDLAPNVPKPIYQDSKESELPRYQPNQPVDTVLEVESGFIAREGIQVGDLVNIDTPR